MPLIPVAGDPMLNFVHRTVQEYIRTHHRMPSEMKSALKNSPHVQRLVSNLTEQYKQVQNAQLRRGRKKISEKTFKSAIHDMVETFIKGFEGHAERRRESEIKKYEREHAADETNDMQSTLEGKSTGVYEDMGLVIPEDQQEQTENHIKEPVKHDILVDYGGRKK